MGKYGSPPPSPLPPPRLPPPVYPYRAFFRTLQQFRPCLPPPPMPHGSVHAAAAAWIKALTAQTATMRDAVAKLDAYMASASKRRKLSGTAKGEGYAAVYDGLPDLLARLQSAATHVLFDAVTGELSFSFSRCLLAGYQDHPVTLYCSMRLCRIGDGVSVTAPPALYLDEHALKVANVSAKPNNWHYDGHVRAAVVTLRTRTTATLFPNGDAMQLDAAERTRRLLHQLMPDAAAESSLPCGAILRPPTGDFPAVACARPHIPRPALPAVATPSKSAVLTCAHFACIPVQVDSDDARDKCLVFLSKTTTVALATETSSTGADLIQLGDARTVFLISPKHDSAAFRHALRAVLTGHTLLHWAGEHADRLRSALGGAVANATWVNVQRISSTKPLPSLTAAVRDLTAFFYSLDMDAAASDWTERPLTAGQVEHAALNAALPFLLWQQWRTADPFPVFWTPSTGVNGPEPRHHAFQRPPAGQERPTDQFLHGHGFTDTELGHYTDGFFDHGFRRLRDGGSRAFQPAQFHMPSEVDTSGLTPMDAGVPARFMDLLRGRRFCCDLCAHVLQVHAGDDFFGRTVVRDPIRRDWATDYDVAHYCVTQLCVVLGVVAPRKRDPHETYQVNRVVAAVVHDARNGIIRAALSLI